MQQAKKYLSMLICNLLAGKLILRDKILAKMQELYDNLMLKAHGVHNETNSLDLMKTAEVTNTNFPRIRSAPNSQQHATDGLNQDRSDAISATKLLLGLNLARLNALSDEEKTTKAIKSAPTFSTSSSNINTFIPSSSHPFLEINSSIAAKQAPKYQHKVGTIIIRPKPKNPECNAFS